MQLVRVMLLVLVACGPKATKPKYDTAKLASELDKDLVGLAAIAKQHRGNCPALIAALAPHVDRMRAHADEVRRIQIDDDNVAKQLRRDVAAYDAKHKGLADTIGGDLGASYQTCTDNKQLLELIDRIPEL
jgi:hypothetical protein